MRPTLFLLTSALLFSAGAVRAEPAAPEIVVVAPRNWGTPVSRAELALMRGGVMLPNGLSLSIGIDIQSRVDGILVLHTIYASDGPIVGTRLFNDGTAPTPGVPAQSTVSMAGDTSAPQISFSRSGSGVSIAPGASASATTVNIVGDARDNWVAAGGQRMVPVEQDGPPVTDDLGTYALDTEKNGAVATFTSDGLSIRHLIGQATGVVVANSGNDRTIDTVSSVNIDLEGAQPVLAANQFFADALALETRIGR